MSQLFFVLLQFSLRTRIPSGLLEGLTGQERAAKVEEKNKKETKWRKKEKKKGKGSWEIQSVNWEEKKVLNSQDHFLGSQMHLFQDKQGEKLSCFSCLSRTSLPVLAIARLAKNAIEFRQLGEVDEEDGRFIGQQNSTGSR